jgi:hypothetical protein
VELQAHYNTIRVERMQSSIQTEGAVAGAEMFIEQTHALIVVAW